MYCKKSVNYEWESLLYIDSKLSDSFSSHTKKIDSTNECKPVIKSSKPNFCSCTICKVYLQIIGYL